MKLKFNLRKIMPVSIHILGWLIFASMPLLLFYLHNPDDFYRFNLPAHFVNLFFQISFFYLNYLFLISRFLLKKKFFLYSIFILGSIIFVLLGIYFVPEILNLHHKMQRPPEAGFFIMMFFTTLVLGFISTGIKTINQWYQAEKQKDILEKEKLVTELAYLKSQMNPHFFFNVLNNICSLARKKSDDTEPAIIKLSQLMRYNLYTSEEDKVELEKEIQYLNDYIDIQRMRLTNLVEIKFKIEGDIYPIKIEPLLFIPFVENAFKHGIHPQKKTIIDINLKVVDSKIIFKITNQVFEHQSNPENNTGIGLKNVKRRLSILYPDKHILTINNKDNQFNIDLTLETHD